MRPKDSIREEIREKSFGYIAVGLGFVAGLAWNEAIRALIDELFPLSRDGIFAKFVYAGVITIVIVVITSYLLGSRDEKGSDEK